MWAAKPNRGENTYFSDLAGYKSFDSEIFAVQENFLKVTNREYYMLDEMDQEMLKADSEGEVSKFPDGRFDAVEAIYSNLTLRPHGGAKDIHGVVYDVEEQRRWAQQDPRYSSSGDQFTTVGLDEDEDENEARTGEVTDAELDDGELPDVSEGEEAEAEEGEHEQFLDEIKIIVSEGFRDILALDTERAARLCLGRGGSCRRSYRLKVRAMLTKMPGHFFTGYQSAQFYAENIVNEAQFRILLEDFFKTNAGARENFRVLTSTYQFTAGVPKEKLYVKMDPSISEARRNYIANGIRAYFRNDQTVLIDLKSTVEGVQSALVLFQIFVAIVGTIALILAFFLLLVSTTQNIKENIWEYGCLRAIGFTKKQGMRVFMYEQYSLIVSSLILGTAVGFILASVVTA